MTVGAPPIRPRSEWAAQSPPRGSLATEAPGDVQFLLVHHTATANDYGPEAVPGLIQSFYRLHTGSARGWPDVAYNFFVDRHGSIWEGRAGRIDAPVRGDATGGSQGLAQLCAFIGDHGVEAPAPAAQGAMVSLLAWLGTRHDIDTSVRATTSFTSRGLNRWPAGARVIAPTIAAHRAMSQTELPGEAAFRLVRDALPAQVNNRRVETTLAATATSTTLTTQQSPSAGAPVRPAPRPVVNDRPSGAPLPLLGTEALAALAAVSGVVALRRRGGTGS